MKTKQLLLIFILGFGILFLVITILITNQQVKDLETNKSAYFSKKELMITGSVIKWKKIAGPTKLIFISPKMFQNKPIQTQNTSIGFVNMDTTRCYVLAELPSNLKVDSISVTANAATYFYNRNEVGKGTTYLPTTNNFERILLETRELERVEIISLQ